MAVWRAALLVAHWVEWKVAVMAGGKAVQSVAKLATLEVAYSAEY